MMKNISLVAQEFRWEKNCGALARVAANFSVESLVFLNPRCDYRGEEAVKYAKHAHPLLKKAKAIKTFGELLKKFDYVVATTSMLGTDYNINRAPLNPEQLSELIQRAGSRKIAIVIGREGEGMSNAEIAKADFVVAIPTSRKYPAMNVSHAAAIILYEIFRRSGEESIGGISMAAAKEKEILMMLVSKTLKKLPFTTETKRNTQKQIWKRFIGKAMLTRREAYGLCAYFRKVMR